MCVNFVIFHCAHKHTPTLTRLRAHITYTHTHMFYLHHAVQKVRTSPVEEPDLSAITVPTTLFDSSIMPKGYQAPLPLQVVKANIKTSYKLGTRDKVDADNTNVRTDTHARTHTHSRFCTTVVLELSVVFLLLLFFFFLEMIDSHICVYNMKTYYVYIKIYM
jgi:hypothetical protein